MDALQVAESVRQACLQAAAAAYEDAGLQGLCAEGRWEAAVGAVRSLDLSQLLAGPSSSLVPPVRSRYPAPDGTLP
jgi:hypothetical protein